MEIGSFLELDLVDFGEYYNQSNIVRLNSARAGIYHAIVSFGLDEIHIPYYMCSSVSNFLNFKGIRVNYYNIDNQLLPLVEKNQESSCFLLVNYFGLFSDKKLLTVGKRFNNVIVDNSQAFFTKPINNSNFLNVYSTRKFFGVPDGCYVIGENNIDIKYEEDKSSETSLFLFKRIEVGSSYSYETRMLNEKRIDNSDIMSMSKLTHKLLQSIDYKSIKNKRKNNFNLANNLFSYFNEFDFSVLKSDEAIPMVYPLVIRDESLMVKLQNKNIYTGRWWNHVLRHNGSNEFEGFLSRFMLPIPIDQRYGNHEFEYILKQLNDLR
ncbi:hypothetical protein [Lunatibacter salilacus]|uniref:hypothetical protein n=1 Tax=Lunatibacter salilacus TaxID=2483804 RepID=UPI00131E7E50|nr:hypothetical protein [Lunatibacter salilacus]